MKKEMMENATGVKLTKKASKNVIRSLSVGLAAMMALSTPIAAFAEDADGQNGSGTTPEPVASTKSEETQATQLQVVAKDASDAIKGATDAVNVVKNDAGELKNSYDETDSKDAKEKAETVEKLAGTTEGQSENEDKTLQDHLTEAGTSVEKVSSDDIKNVTANKEATDKALDSVSDKVEEVTDIVDDVNKKVAESNTAITDANNQIKNATTVEETQDAYNKAEGVVGAALADVKAAEESYNQKLAEYEEAKKALEDAQNKYNDAVAVTNSDVNTAYSELIEAEQKAKELQDAADAAQKAIPELTEAQKAALEIINLQKESKENNTNIQWAKIDTQFNIIIEKYYVPEKLGIKGTEENPITVKCEWKKNGGDNEQNYCEVTITDANGQVQKKYLNYKLTDNNSGDDLIVFDKVVDVKNANGDDIKDEEGNKITVKLEELKTASTKIINGTEYSVINVDGQYFMVSSDTTEEINVENKEENKEYCMNATDEKSTSYKVTEDGKLVKVITGDITTIQKYENQSLKAINYGVAKKERTDLSSDGWDLSTTTLDANVESSFTLTIDMSKINISTKVVAYDKDKEEKESVKSTAHDLLKELTDINKICGYLELPKELPEGLELAITTIDNCGVNDVSNYKNETNPTKWYDHTDAWEALRGEKAVYSGVFSGKIVITISAKASANLANLSDEDGTSKEDGMKDSTLKSLSSDKVNTNNLLANLEKAYKTENATKRNNEDNSVIFGSIVKSGVQTKVSYTYSGEKHTNIGKEGTKTITYNDTKGTKLSNTGYINNATLTGFTASAKKAQEEKNTLDDKAKQLKKDADEAADKVTQAKNTVRDLTIKLGGLWETVGYTNSEVAKLQAQLEQAKKDLKEAQEKADELNEALNELEGQRDSKITELTPAPAPGEGGSTTTPGGTTSPSGTETTPGGAATTPAGTVTTAAAPASAATIVTTATADAAPVQIAETPVALAAAATPAAVTGTAAANANTNADADTNADENTDVTIADEETPLAANGAQESTTIGDEETPLAAEAGAVENKQQEKMSWWWLLIIALLGVTGEEMYRRNKKKKAEAAQKDEK